MPSRLGTLGTAAAAALLLSACSEEESGPPLFTQADLAGDWNVSAVLQGTAVAAGTAPGWVRARLHVDAIGDVAVVSTLDSAGSTSVPTVPIAWWIDRRTGAVTSASGLLPDFHGQLNRSRTVIAATATQGGQPSLQILQKVAPGVTFSAADLAGRSFVYHVIGSGGSTAWEHGTAAIDASGVLSRSNRVAPSGALPDQPHLGTVSVDADGRVTVDFDPTWVGVMSADRSLLVVTRTPGPARREFALEVLALAGQTFVPEDLAGDYGYHLVVGSAWGGAWAHGRIRFDDGGRARVTAYLDSLGSTALPPPFGLDLDAAGVLLPPAGAAADFHGVMTSGKDLFLGTETDGYGAYALVVAAR